VENFTVSIFSFRKPVSPFDGVEKWLSKNKVLSESQREEISSLGHQSNPSELIDIEAALPEGLCHMQMAEVVPSNGRYTLKIDCRIIENKKLVKTKILPRAAVYVICDILGRQFGLDYLRIPEGIGLPISNESMGPMHTVIRIAESIK
jgi:hypothetical protein